MLTIRLDADEVSRLAQACTYAALACFGSGPLPGLETVPELRGALDAAVPGRVFEALAAFFETAALSCAYQRGEIPACGSNRHGRPTPSPRPCWPHCWQGLSSAPSLCDTQSSAIVNRYGT